MPELPEVETVVRELRAAGLIGRKILHACVFWPRTIAAPAAASFPRAIRGLEIRALTRRAKYVVVTLTGGYTLLIHLRMSGHLDVLPPQIRPQRHDRVVLTLDNGRQLHFEDTR